MGFPAGRVAWRAHSHAEDQLARFPWVIVTPIVVALLAAALAVSVPSETVKHGRVIGPSFIDSAGPAAGGGVAGVFVVYVLLWAWGYIRYYGWGDPIWSSSVICQGTNIVIGLGSNYEPAPDLGNPQVTVLRPGKVRFTPPTIAPGDSPWFFIGSDWDAGEYEVRWYRRATKTDGPEIARRKFELREGQPVHQKTYWFED